MEADRAVKIALHGLGQVRESNRRSQTPGDKGSTCVKLGGVHEVWPSSAATASPRRAQSATPRSPSRKRRTPPSSPKGTPPSSPKAPAAGHGGKMRCAFGAAVLAVATRASEASEGRLAVRAGSSHRRRAQREAQRAKREADLEAKRESRRAAKSLSTSRPLPAPPSIEATLERQEWRESNAEDLDNCESDARKSRPTGSRRGSTVGCARSAAADAASSAQGAPRDA